MRPSERAWARSFLLTDSTGGNGGRRKHRHRQRSTVENRERVYIREHTVQKVHLPRAPVGCQWMLLCESPKRSPSPLPCRTSSPLRTRPHSAPVCEEPSAKSIGSRRSETVRTHRGDAARALDGLPSPSPHLPLPLPLPPSFLFGYTAKRTRTAYTVPGYTLRSSGIVPYQCILLTTNIPQPTRSARCGDSAVCLAARGPRVASSLRPP